MRLLFVCTGNTCRSPLAEAIARRVAEERGLDDVIVGSAGTAAWEGTSASDAALLVGMERSLDVGRHRAREVTAQIVADHDLILAMGPHHVERLEQLGGRGKAHLLTTFASRGASERSVSDPFGGDLEVYRGTYDELDREVRRALDRMPHGTPDTP